MNVPTYLLSGWQDIFRDQTLAQYQHLRGRGVPVELTVGPWSHFGLAEDWPLLVKESLSFLQRNLTQSDGVRKPALRVHVGGTNHWSGMESWPPDELNDEVYFLQPDAGLGTSRPVSTQPTCYRYDPMAPTPSVGGPTLAEDAGRRDNRGLESREDVLTFTTTELQQPVAIAGSPRLELYFRSTARQTDFVARICDVDPQGRSYNVTGPSKPLPFQRGNRCENTFRRGTGEVDCTSWLPLFPLLAGACVEVDPSASGHSQAG